MAVPGGLHAEVASQNLTTAAHMGYAVETSSTTGRAGAAGSLAMLDALYRWPTGSAMHGVEVGLRTLASGGRLGDRGHYRLSAGPLVVWRATEQVSVSGAVARFGESGTEDGREVCRSSGYLFQGGISRQTRLTRILDLSWGASLGRYWGAFDGPRLMTDAGPAAKSNVGATRALEIALRTRL